MFNNESMLDVYLFVKGHILKQISILVEHVNKPKSFQFIILALSSSFIFQGNNQIQLK